MILSSGGRRDLLLGVPRPALPSGERHVVPHLVAPCPRVALPPRTVVSAELGSDELQVGACPVRIFTNGISARADSDQQDSVSMQEKVPALLPRPVHAARSRQTPHAYRPGPNTKHEKPRIYISQPPEVDTCSRGLKLDQSWPLSCFENPAPSIHHFHSTGELCRAALCPAAWCGVWGVGCEVWGVGCGVWG